MAHVATMNELKAQRSDFGLRLHNAMQSHGPLCVGIDPHRKLLLDWGYNIDAQGAELFSMRMLQAANGRAAAVKIQSSMFERYGSQGFEALERVLYAARQMDVITIVDGMHGGLPTLTSALADAYFKPDSPLLADAITLLPYYGARSLSGLIHEALDNGRGVFIASLTSNQEGMNLQTSIRQGGEYAGYSVAYGITSACQKFNKDIDGLGSVGLIIGAHSSQWINNTDIHPASFTGPILAPGYGISGGRAEDLVKIFKGTHGNVLVPVSRYIAVHGPKIADLASIIDQVAADVRQALVQASLESEQVEQSGQVEQGEQLEQGE